MRWLAGSLAVLFLSGMPQGTTSWTERFDGGYCFASAEAFADRCELEVVARDQGHGATGVSTVRCGDEADACGQRYRCACDPAAVPNPAWRVDRHVTRTAGEGADELTVHFRGGVCRVALRAAGTCAVSGTETWLEQDLQRERGFTRTLRCGKSVELCGERILCSCAGPARTLRTPGVPAGEPDAGR